MLLGVPLMASDGSCVKQSAALTHHKLSSPDCKSGDNTASREATRHVSEAVGRGSCAACSQAVQELLKMVSSRHAEVRLVAARALRNIGGPKLHSSSLRPRNQKRSKKAKMGEKT